MLKNSLPDQFPILTLNPDAQPFQKRSLSDFLDQKILHKQPKKEYGEDLWGERKSWGGKQEKMKREPQPNKSRTGPPSAKPIGIDPRPNTKRSPTMPPSARMKGVKSVTRTMPSSSRNNRVPSPGFNSFPRSVSKVKYTHDNTNPSPHVGHSHPPRSAEPIHHGGGSEIRSEIQVQAPEDVVNTVVFVKGLKYTVNRKEIFSHFSSCGNILDIELPMCRRRRGRSRGICWITFERPVNVEKALRLDGTAFQDREIRVFLAKSARAQNHGNRTTLFVWGLPPHIGDLDLAKKEITRTQLEAMFLFAGEIKSIRIPKPSIRGPIAFVEFFEPDDALYGLCLDGRIFHGSTIRVEFARNAR